MKALRSFFASLSHKLFGQVLSDLHVWRCEQRPIQKVKRPKGNWRITVKTPVADYLFIGFGRKSFFAKIELLLRKGFRRCQIWAYQRNQFGKCFRYSILRHQVSHWAVICRNTGRYISLVELGVYEPLFPNRIR